MVGYTKASLSHVSKLSLENLWVPIRAFTANLKWIWTSGPLQELIQGMANGAVNKSVKTTFAIFYNSTAMLKLTSIVTVLGLVMIFVKVGMIIWQTYSVNIEGQQSSPDAEYFKRIVYSLIVLSLAPGIIINGFIIVTILSSVMIREDSYDDNGLPLFNIYTGTVAKNYISHNTYCYDGQLDTYYNHNGENVSSDRIAQMNRGGSKFYVLGSPEDIGDENTWPIRAREDSLTSADINAMDKAFCKGIPVISATKSQMPRDWKFKDTNESIFVYESRGDRVHYPTMVGEALTLDLDSFNRTAIRYTDRIDGIEEFGAGKSTTGLANNIMAIAFALVQLLFFYKFFKDLFERIVDIFGAVFSVWLYAPAYISTTRNQMITELIRRVASIYITHAYSLLLIKLWNIMVFGDIPTVIKVLDDVGFHPIILRMGISYGMFKALGKGNTSIQQFFDKTSSGDMIQGAQKVVSDVARGAGQGKGR